MADGLPSSSYFRAAWKQFPMRSWSNFLEFKSFSVPASPNQAAQRLQVNSHYFFTNYLLVGLLFFLYAGLNGSLTFLIIALAVALGWLYLLVVDNLSMDKQKLMALAAGSALLLIISSGVVLLVYFLAIVFHAVFRSKSLKSSLSTLPDRLKNTDVASALGKALGGNNSNNENSSSAQDENDSDEDFEIIDIEGGTSSTPSATTTTEQYHKVRDAIKQKYQLN